MSFLMTPGTGVQFDPNADEYRCCCGSFHVRIAAAMIAVLEAVILLANFIASLAVPQLGGAYGPIYEGSAYIGPVVSFLFPLIALSLLFLGLKYDSSSYLLAHLALRLIAMIFLLICLVISVIVMAKGPENYTATLGLTSVASRYPTTVHKTLEITVGILLGVFLLTFLLQVWFFVIIFKCYHFFYNAALYGPTAYYNGGFTQNSANDQGQPDRKKSSVVSMGGLSSAGAQYGGLAGPHYPPAYPTRIAYPVGQQRGYYYQ